MNCELKPCPFCEGEAVIKSSPLYGHSQYLFKWKVSCGGCGVETPYYQDKKNKGGIYLDVDGRANAIAAWNRRADMEDKNEL